MITRESSYSTSEILGSQQEKNEQGPENFDEDRGQAIGLGPDQVKHWARQYLEEFYQSSPDPETINSFEYDSDLMKTVEQISTRETRQDRRITLEYRAGIENFYQELVDFTKEKIELNEDPDKLQKFLESISQGLFSGSGGTLDHMSFSKLLSLTAETTRVPELQGLFGQSMTGELVYKFSFASKEDIEKVEIELGKCSTVEQIDLLNQIQTLGAHALASGYSQISGFENITSVIADLAQKSSSPLVRLQAEAVMERLEEETDHPSYGVVTTKAESSDARMNEKRKQGDIDMAEKLERQILPDILLKRREYLTPIASDAVGVMGQGGILQKIAKVESWRDLPESSGKVSDRDLQQLQTALDELSRGNHLASKIVRIIGFVNQRILLPQARFAEIKTEDLPKVWHEVVTEIPESEYGKIFEVIVREEEREKKASQYEYQVRQEIEASNQERSIKFLQQFGGRAEYVIQTLPSKWRDSFEKKLSKFKKYWEQNKIEQSFHLAEQFVQALDMGQKLSKKKGQRSEAGLSPESREAIQVLAGDLEQLRSDHKWAWEDYRTRVMQGSQESDTNEQKRHQEKMEYSGILDKLKELFPDLISGLKSYATNLRQAQRAYMIPVHFEPVKNLSKDSQIMPFTGKESENLALLLQDIHRPSLRKKIEDDLDIQLSEVPLQSQVQFLRFLEGQDIKQYERLKQILHDSPQQKYELLKSFVVFAEDSTAGHHLLTLAERLKDSPAVATKVFGSCNDYVERATKKSHEILEDLSREYPGLELTEDMVTQALINRGRDFIVEVNEEADKGRSLPKLINEFSAELDRPLDEQIVRTQFKSIAELLNRENIDLGQYERVSVLVLQGLLKDPEKRRVTLVTLSRMGKLEPIPEIHWRVDRSLEDYNRRLGINLSGFLEEKGQHKPNQKLLEIGPGSGMSKLERAEQGMNKYYNEISLSDKIYYPLVQVIEKLLDFEKIEAESGEALSEEDRYTLADFLYKSMVIANGQTAQDTFEYNEQIQTAIGKDINNLKQILPNVTENFRLTQTVPQSISTRDSQGNVVYPYKIEQAKQTVAFQKAKELLDKTITEYLRADWQEVDYHELIDAFPPNVLLGDIKDITRLSPNQIDVELGVRSTVYIRGEEYEKFLGDLFERLSPGGVVIDDSIRDNDGWYYRIAEVLAAKDKNPDQNMEVMVVLGPGFSGEDYRQDSVPLAMIATKDGSHKALTEKYLKDGHKLVRLEDLAADSAYLKTLDKTGWTAKQVAEVLRKK